MLRLGLPSQIQELPRTSCRRERSLPLTTIARSQDRCRWCQTHTSGARHRTCVALDGADSPIGTCKGYSLERLHSTKSERPTLVSYGRVVDEASTNPGQAARYTLERG